MTATSPGSLTRITWMDAVRGTAILLLLIWHASAVPELYGGEMPDVIRTVNAFFIPYRMPTLMLLSGMLLTRSLRKPLPTYYAGKFSMILWPYLVWVIIAKLTFLEVIGLPWWHWRAWYATSYLWFLFFIGVYYLIAPALSRLPAWVPVALAAVVGITLPADTTEQRLAYFAVFFFCGNWLGQHQKTMLSVTGSLHVFWLAIPVAAMGIAAAIWTDAPHYSVLTAPVSIAGMLVLAAVFSRLTNTARGAPLLQSMGRSSLVYYVSHFPAMALLSLLLSHQVPPLALAVLNLCAALALGAVLSALKHRVPVRWLFEAPRPVVRAVENAISAVVRLLRMRPADRTGGGDGHRPHR